MTARQERELRDVLMRLGFAYDKKRGEWVRGDVVVSAGVSAPCARPWLTVRRGGLAAQIHVSPEGAHAHVAYHVDADAPLDKRDLLEFHDLVRTLLKEVRGIKPEC